MLESLPYREIASLSLVRLQKSYVQNNRILVLEIYSRPFKRLFLIADTSKETPTLHVQPKKPPGTKSIHPLGLLLAKHGQGKTLTLRLMDERPGLVALFHDEQIQYQLVMVVNQEVSLGLFKGDRCLAFLKTCPELSLPRTLHEPPPLMGLLANQVRATEYEHSVNQNLGNTIIAQQRSAKSSEIKKLKRLLANINKDYEHCQKILRNESNAELLRANLHLAQRGLDSLMVTDYTTDPPCKKTLILDPALSPKDFLAKQFTRIKKARRGLLHIAPRLLETKMLLEKACHELDALTKTNEPLAQRLPVEQLPPSKQAPAKRIERKPFKTFISSDGIKILVGKSGADSDTLTLKTASGNDFWFHVESYPGAHVIVKCPEAALPDKTLREAALLAKHFSKAKEHPTSVVTYTKVKHVQKPKGFAPGKVLISQEKRIEIARNDQEIYQIINHP